MKTYLIALGLGILGILSCLDTFIVAETAGIKRRTASGVSQITAGTNITLSPSNGKGNVTVTASGGMTLVVSSNVQANTFTGREFGDGVVQSSHIANGTILGQDLALDIVRSSHIVAGSLLGREFGSAIIQSTHLAAGVGSDPTIITTFTHTFKIGGGPVISSASFIAIDNAYFEVDRDTINIQSVRAFCAIPSTYTAVFSIRRATGTTGVGDSSWGAHAAIHSSSFTLSPNSRYGETIIPDTITRVLHNEALALWTLFVPSSGTLNENCAVTMRYWKERQ